MVFEINFKLRLFGVLSRNCHMDYMKELFLEKKKIRNALKKYISKKYFVDELIFRKNVKQKSNALTFVLFTVE